MKHKGTKKTTDLAPLTEAELRQMRRNGEIEDWGEDMTETQRKELLEFIEKMKKEGKM